MPTPKFFRKFYSKDSTEDSPDEGPDDTPTTRTKAVPPGKTVVADPNIPQYSDAMKEARSATNAELPQAQGVGKFLNRVEQVQNEVTLLDERQAIVNALTVPVGALANAPQIASAIEKGVNTFMQSVPVLIKALDEVAKVHPFISVAVLAFKTVYTLEVKLRSNDKRAIALYAEMRDMMAVLVQLKDVSDPAKVASDGQTIEGRMQKLCVKVAEDIERCANTCDTYLKKKILVKIFAGPMWEGRLLEFVRIFTNRRKEFEFALTIHTAVGADEANIKLAELNQKMEVMMEMFQKFVTPEQRQLAFLVEQKGGGDAIIDNEQVMRELSDAETLISAPTGMERRRPAKKFDFVEIQREIRDDPAVAIEENAKFFNRKFDLQRKLIQEDIKRAISHKGDRITSAVTAGPHERVLDSDSTEDSPDDTPRTKNVPPGKTVVADPNVLQYSDAMKEAWSAANMELPRAQGVEKFLNGVEQVQNAVTLSDGQQAVVDALANAPQIASAIEKGVNTFMEAVPVLMKALDEVAKVHPFISVAVLAFKAVYTLEVTRRSNDKRVVALYAEMRDMMAVLVQLKDVSDPAKVAPDGQTIEGRMQKLCAKVAKDIKRCANTCDTYLKKKILVKIFAGPMWEGRLLEFVEIFTNRRKEFEFALTIHTAVGVDEANIKLDTVDERTAELSQKMEVMMEMFQKFVTPEQRQLAFLVEKRGGDAIIDNGQVMKELSEAEALISAPAGMERRGPAKKFDLVEIQREIRDDPAVAIERNAELFDRMFDNQRRQIQEDIERAVSREGDRIISAVTAGPHERILDSDLYNIWKDMGWRGSVKARHFILALKDYYSEMVAGGDGEGVAGSDQWALQYIGVNYVRSILEAFDDDASGFVTVKEANNFTRSRPLDWSLPHWLAYWAIGWQTTCTSYCERIEEIFDAMIRLSDEVLPENREQVNKYLCCAWMEATMFVRSFRWEWGTEDLATKFKSHVDAEEARLQTNLEDFKYDIDSDVVVRLISGNGRIETTLFPMLYLILKRDLQRISLARKHVLADSELPDAVQTILYVTGAAMYRIADLRAIFEQHNLSPKEQFDIFAKGLYGIASEGRGFDGDKLRTLPDPIPARNEIIPDPDLIPLNVLRYPTENRHKIDFAAYDSPAAMVPSSVDGSDAVLGTYYGFIYEYQVPFGPMKTWTLNRGNEENSIVASGTHYDWGHYKTYTIAGTTGPLEDGKMPVELETKFASMWVDVTLMGYFDPEENSIKGTVTMPGGRSGEFVFKRHPDLVRFYPAPSAINAGVRWKFAKTVILDRIRQESWSPLRILRRIRDGKRYMELAIRDEYYGKKLDDDEYDEYCGLFPSLYESDVRFYASLIKIKLSKTPIHSNTCDSCHAIIGGARVLCMDCHDTTTTVDLCSEPGCFNSVLTLEGRLDPKSPHTPNHNMLKVHRVLFNRDTVMTERDAKEALEAARKTLSELNLKKKPMPKCIHCQNVVSLPCWYCVDCTKNFICADCEHNCLAFNEIHTKKHTLVRVFQKVDESKVSTEERLKAFEERLGSVQDELSKMRQLLSKLFEKGVEGSPSDPLTKGDILDAAMAEPSLVVPLPAKGEGDQGGDEEGSGHEDANGVEGEGEDEERK